MSDHIPRFVLDSASIQAGLVGDVLCVQLMGRMTVRRLHTCLHRLHTHMARRDHGALVINAMDASLHATVPDLATLWKGEDCQLAARPCAVVYDAHQEGAAVFYEALGMMLAAGQPARIMGAFAGGLLMDATAWATRRAQGFRLEQTRRESRASFRASSGKPRRKRDPDPGRS